MPYRILPLPRVLPVLALLSFSVLIPVSALAQALVIDHVKITESIGGFSGNLDDRDSFGNSCTTLGDLDGDGVVDIAVGAPRDDDGASDAGAVWILFLNADGTVKGQQKISATQGDFTGPLHKEDFFGTSVASMGDRDGDGVTDIAVGAIFDDDGGPDRGAVWLIDLNPDGTVKADRKISNTQGGFTGDLIDGALLGSSVAALGDLDGNGVGDLASGTRQDDDGGLYTGAMWILFLNADGTVKAYQKISNTQGGLGGGLDPGDRFGVCAGALGDLDRDGVTDLAVGAYQDDDGGRNRGAVWILFLNADGTVKAHQKISNTQGGFTGVLHDDDTFGKSVNGLGDMNGDGTLDLGAGAMGDDDGGLNRGAAWILFLNPDGTVKASQKLSDLQGGLEGALGTANYFGSSVTPLGDMDGNGTIDLAVGSHYDNAAGPKFGAMYTLFLEAFDVNRLLIGSGTGLPKAEPFPVPVSLTNLDEARGLQFTIHDVPDAVTVTDVVPLGRASEMTASWVDRGDADIVLYGLGGESIRPGAGPVMNLMVEINSVLAPVEGIVLQGKNILMSTGTGVLDIPGVDGSVTAGRRTGDLNGDNRVDVGDVIRLVEIILNTGRPPTPDELAEADCTGDAEINVGDVTCLVDRILGDAAASTAAPATMAPLTVVNDREVRGFQFTVEGSVEKTQDLAPFVLHTTSRPSGTTAIAFDPAGRSWPQGTRVPLRTDVSVAEAGHAFRAYGPGGEPLAVTVDGTEIHIGGIVSGPLLHIRAGRPNPFHGGTTIRFSTDRPGKASAAIYDVQGKRVAVLPERHVEAGEHSWPWTATDTRGHALPAGIYLATVTFEGQRGTMRLAHLGP